MPGPAIFCRIPSFPQVVEIPCFLAVSFAPNRLPGLQLAMGAEARHTGHAVEKLI